MFKRVFDIVISLFVLVLFGPVIAAAACLLKLWGKGPVLRRQKMAGRGFNTFLLLTLRSADPREEPTRLGGFLSSTKIDRLPMFFNVLKGEMSVVGPRPEPLRYARRFRSEFKDVLKVRPGIFSNEDASRAAGLHKDNIKAYIPEKIRQARAYIADRSLLHDFELLILRHLMRRVYKRSRVRWLLNAMTPYRKPVVISAHVSIFILSNYLAFCLRFDKLLSYGELSQFIGYLPFLLLMRLVFLFSFELDRGIWRYSSVKDILKIIFATAFGTLAFSIVVRYGLGDLSYPRSVYIIDFILNVMILGGLRLFRRINEKMDHISTAKRVLVIGAGSATDMLLRDIDHSTYYNYNVVGLIDDDIGKKGLKVRDVPVLGARKDLPAIIESRRPDEFLLAIPSASSSALEEIIRDLRQYSLPVKSLPSLWGLLTGKDSISQIKAVEPEDVLFRAPISEKCQEFDGFLKGKTVLITGGGGSIGSELSRQVASYGPRKLVIFEKHEESLYKIDMELRSSALGRDADTGTEIHSVIGDILDTNRVSEVFEKYRPEIVFHAAAYKHVPLMEHNPYESFKTNVLGTRIVAGKASEAGVERFTLISTDKAVNSTNIMGMSKKLAEEVVKAFSTVAGKGGTKYVTVRFGNVLGSSGSVVPLFNGQIKKGGPVTVTHPEIIRYFMTIPEAVNLILQSSAIADGGEVFVLDMGEPVKILDMAKRMIRLHGYRPDIDIPIVFTGLRPGEKMYEELFNTDEIVKKTMHSKINKAVSRANARHDLIERLAQINDPGLFKDISSSKAILNGLLRHDEIFEHG